MLKLYERMKLATERRVENDSAQLLLRRSISLFGFKTEDLDREYSAKDSIKSGLRREILGGALTSFPSL